MFDEKTRAAVAGEPRGLRRPRSPAAASRSTPRSARFRPLLRDIIPVMQNLVRAATPSLERLRRRARRHGARSSRPPRRRRRRCSATSTRRCAALREVARPYIQDSITEAQPALDAGIRELPAPAAVPGQHRGPVARAAARARARCATAAPALADALGAGIEVLPKTPPLNQRLDVAAAGAADVLQRPAGAARHPGHRPSSCKSLRPDARLPRAGPDGLQLRDAVVPQHLLAAERGRHATAPGSASSSSPRRRARTTRAARPPRPANGPTVDNHLHTNPYPNTASPGQPQECEAGNEPYLAGKTVIGNVPGTQQAAPRATREERT